jgi:hypothetical protein
MVLKFSKREELRKMSITETQGEQPVMARTAFWQLRWRKMNGFKRYLSGRAICHLVYIVQLNT